MSEPSDLNIFDQRARAAGFGEELIDAFLAGKNEAFGGAIRDELDKRGCNDCRVEAEPGGRTR